jgi:hypothetical protein
MPIPILITPIKKVKNPTINQLFRVYSRVLPMTKYIEARDSSTTSMFEYLNSIFNF